MICIIAGNYLEAQRYAYGQQWDDDEWFYPKDELDLVRRNNFHVLVIGTAGSNVPESYFNSIYNLAKRRGRIGRSA
jgi:hypothetical protein